MGETSIFDYLSKINEYSKNCEVMIGLVAPLGVDLDHIESIINNYLLQFGYETKSIILSSQVNKIDKLKTKISEKSEEKRIDTYMDACNEARNIHEDILAALGISQIYEERVDDDPNQKIAYLFRSLKHPKEVELLRIIYGKGFYLIGINSSHERRLHFLKERKGISDSEAKRLIDRDNSEDDKCGQKMIDTFHLSDCFIDMDLTEVSDQIGRILDLIFGKPYLTPTKDEYAMFLAFAASVRSGSLSRQVGAVIASKTGEIIATGANDVPCAGGGLYWADHKDRDQRDYRRGSDSNDDRKKKLLMILWDYL
ncbi:MAG: hypothetical protein GY874_07700 [Desulfobacteraceae bacterium]|nr:hypothetical protein [Desulfobacteraceae bacterium]